MREHLQSDTYERSDGNLWFWDANRQNWKFIGPAPPKTDVNDDLP